MRLMVIVSCKGSLEHKNYLWRNSVVITKRYAYLVVFFPVAMSAAHAYVPLCSQTYESTAMV